MKKATAPSAPDVNHGQPPEAADAGGGSAWKAAQQRVLRYLNVLFPDPIDNLAVAREALMRARAVSAPAAAAGHHPVQAAMQALRELLAEGGGLRLSADSPCRHLPAHCAYAATPDAANERPPDTPQENAPGVAALPLTPALTRGSMVPDTVKRLSLRGAMNGFLRGRPPR